MNIIASSANVFTQTVAAEALDHRLACFKLTSAIMLPSALPLTS